jgi:signal peptidase I
MTAVPPEPVAAHDAPKPGKGAGAGPAHELAELAKTIVYALAIALVLRVLLFQPFTIPSASMEPTLLEGDYIIVSKYAYGWSRHSIPFSPKIIEGRIMGKQPERGDVVVFKLPRDGRTDYIKRVVGLPGDTVQMNEGVLYINGQPAPQELLSPIQLESAFGMPRQVERYRETLPGGRSHISYSFGPGGEVDNTELYQVPAGHFFMMGDNRDNSVDSRYPLESGVGFVPAENLVGKAEIILFSWEPQAVLFKPWTWVTESRPSRFGQRLQ